MNPASPIRILLASDHAVVRDGLAAILNSEPDLTAIANAFRTQSFNAANPIASANDSGRFL